MCIKAILDAIFKRPTPRPTPKPPVTPPSSNKNPVAYPPFTAALSFARGSRIDYDLRYREHGCKNGTPQTVTGAFDPDGDPLDYQAVCDWSVFAYVGDSEHPEKINGKWLRFPKDDKGEQQALVTLFVGYEGDQPPYTYAPKSCCLPNQPGAPQEGCNPDVGAWNFTYVVRDGNGAMASHTVTP